MAMNVSSVQRNPSIDRLYRNPSIDRLYRNPSIDRLYANPDGFKMVLPDSIIDGQMIKATVGPADRVEVVESNFWNRYQQGIMGAIVGVVLGAIGAIVFMNMTKGRRRRR